MAHHPSLPELAKQEGISLPTLYAWRRQARDKGVLMPSGDDTPDGWNSADKFNAVLQTATMSQSELAEFCRTKGLYPEQVQRWKEACQNANDWEQKTSAQLEKERREDRNENKNSKLNCAAKRKPSPNPPPCSFCEKSSMRCSGTRLKADELSELTSTNAKNSSVTSKRLARPGPPELPMPKKLA